MKSAPLFLAASLCATLCAAVSAATGPSAQAQPAPEEVVPELVNASLPELRDALNEISDTSIEAARHARDLQTDLEAALITTTISTPEIDALRARRDEILRELSEAEAKLRAAILASDEFKERAAEASAAREKADELAVRRTAVRALLAKRRREQPIPQPPAPPAEQ